MSVESEAGTRQDGERPARSVYEIANVLVVEGAEAEFLAGVRVGLGVILRAPGCVHATVFRGVEQPREFRLVIEWRDVAAHEAFRSSPQFGEYRSTIGQFLDGTPTHSHFTREIEMATAQGDDA